MFRRFTLQIRKKLVVKLILSRETYLARACLQVGMVFTLTVGVTNEIICSTRAETLKVLFLFLHGTLLVVLVLFWNQTLAPLAVIASLRAICHTWASVHALRHILD